MQKVTLKYDLVSNYDAPRNYIMEFNLDDMILDDFLNELAKFAILVGYNQDVVKDAFHKE